MSDFDLVEDDGSFSPLGDEFELVDDQPISAEQPKFKDVVGTVQNDSAASEFELRAQDGADRIGIGRARNALRNFQKGAGELVAALPKGIAEGATNLLNDIQGTDYDPEQTFTYAIGKSIDDWLESHLPTDEEYDQEFLSGQLPRGAGSAAGFMATGLAGRAAGIPELTTVGVTGMLASGSQGVEDYKNTLGERGEEQDPKDRERAFELNALLGASEAIPVERALRHLDKITGGTVKEIIKDGVKGGIEELLQEITQTIGGNLIASDIVEYDEERDMFTGAQEAAEVGFSVGFLMNVLTSAIGGRRGNLKTEQTTLGGETVELPTEEQFTEGLQSVSDEIGPEFELLEFRDDIEVTKDGKASTKEQRQGAATLTEAAESYKANNPEGIEYKPLDPNSVEVDSKGYATTARQREVLASYVPQDVDNDYLLLENDDQKMVKLYEQGRYDDVIDLQQRRNLRQQEAETAEMPSVRLNGGGTEPFTDKRLLRPEFRGPILDEVNSLLEGQNRQYKFKPGTASNPQEAEIEGRLPSANPDWYKRISDDVSVKQIRKAVDKALAGRTLGEREARAVGYVLDFISDQRSEQVGYAQENREQNTNERRELEMIERAMRDYGAAAKHPAFARESDQAPRDFLYDDGSYLPEMDEGDRKLVDIFDQALDLGVPDSELDAIVDLFEDSDVTNTAKVIQAAVENGNESSETSAGTRKKTSDRRSDEEVSRAPTESPGSEAESASQEEVSLDDGPQDLFGAAPVGEQALENAKRKKEEQRNGGDPNAAVGPLFDDSIKQTDIDDAPASATSQPITDINQVNLSDFEVNVDVVAEDTGDTYSMKKNAAVAIRQLNKRIETITALLECVKG